MVESWRSLLQYLENIRLHAGAVPKDIVVPEPKHLPPTLFQPRGSLLVGLRAFVLAAVGLNDQAALDTGKVDDKGTKGPLPPEFEASELTIAQNLP